MPARARLSLALVLSLIVPASAPAAPVARATPAEAADTLGRARLAAYADRLDALGCSGQLLVARRGAVVFERACGLADRRFGTPMTDGSQLAAGSVTKSFVAAAVLRLRAQRKLRLEDPLGRHLPGVPAAYAGVTLVQLLSHTAGVERSIPDGLDDAARDEVVRAILARPPAAAPGERFLYSDAGFDLLAAVVERVSGASFDAFLRRELLFPAGLERTGIAGALGMPVLEPACGYERGRRVAAWREWPGGWSGAGSGRLVTTARDLWRWGEALRGGALLGADGWRELTTVRAPAGEGVGYGLGLWVRDPAGGARVVVIGGEVPGYRGVCRIEPAADLVVVVLVNDDPRGDGRERHVIAETLAALARGEDPPLPPAVTLAGPDAARALAGRWTLDGGGRAEVWEEGGRLWLGLSGQAALDSLADGDEAALARRRVAAQRTLVLARAVVQQDTAAARAAFSEDEFARGFGPLTRRLRGLIAAYGDLQRVEGLGAIGAAGGAAERAVVRLVLLDHTVDVSLGYAGGTLWEVGPPEEPAAPLRLPVAAGADGGFVACDLAGGGVIRLRPSAGGDTLTLTRPQREVRATRAR